MISFGSMAKRSFLSRVVRNEIRKDLLYFFLPWIIVMCIEALFFVRDLVKQPQSLFSFSVERIIGLTLVIIGSALLVVGQVTLFRNYSSLLVIHKDH